MAWQYCDQISAPLHAFSIPDCTKFLLPNKNLYKTHTILKMLWYKYRDENKTMPSLTLSELFLVSKTCFKQMLVNFFNKKLKGKVLAQNIWGS